jgi:hypothetical protein
MWAERKEKTKLAAVVDKLEDSGITSPHTLRIHIATSTTTVSGSFALADVKICDHDRKRLKGKNGGKVG